MAPVVSSHLLIRAEDVEGQRFLSLADEADGVVHVAHSHNGQQRAEDLLLHQPGVRGHILQHSRGCMENVSVHWEAIQISTQYSDWFTSSLYPLTNVALWGVTLSSHNRSVTLHQTHDSVEMMLVDDSAVVRWAFGISAIKLLGWINRSWWDSRHVHFNLHEDVSSDRTYQ